MRPYCLMEWFSHVISFYRSGRSIELIQSTARLKTQTGKKESTHMHAISKQGLWDWLFDGVCVHRTELWIWVRILFEKDRCVLSHQDRKFNRKCFWKAPHSYSNRLMATNRQQHSTIKHWQWTVASWPVATFDLCFAGCIAVYGRLGGSQEKRTQTLYVCFCVEV